MTQVQRRAVRGAAGVAALVMATALVGCQNFFVCDKASCTDNGGGGSTGAAGNVAYVANNVSDSTKINGYTLGTTTLSATTSSPYEVNFIPAALAVSRNNKFLYMATVVTSASTQTQAKIFGFSIGTGGALTVLNNGAEFADLPLGSLGVAAMDVSADGQWLVVASKYDLISPSDSPTIQAYSLNASTGALIVSSSVVATSYASTFGTPVVSAVKIAPSGQYISVALGTGGVITFPFNATTGAISAGSVFPINPSDATVGGYDLAIDSGNLLYVAATDHIYVYQVGLTSTLPTVTPLSGAGIETGPTGPWSIALDGTSYVYAGATSSGGANLIYAFSNKSGTLTPITSTPTIAAPATTTKIGVDSTGAYLLADGYDTSGGLKLYSITAATGVLSALDTAPTGVAASGNVSAPTALALSH